MAQLTQLHMVNGSASMNVQADDVAAYLAAGWTIVGIRYSEGGEGLDTTSLVLMVKDPDRIYVRAGSVASYQAQGYRVEEIIYGSAAIVIRDAGGNLVFLDTPAFSAAEIGAVAATTLVVTFTTEVSSADYAAGVTIKVDTVAAAIASATRQTNHAVVHYIIPAVTSIEVVTWEYDDLTGGIVSEQDSTPLDDVAAQTAINNV